MEQVNSPWGLLPKGWRLSTIDEEKERLTDYVANGSFASLASNVHYKDTEDYAVLIRLVDFNNDFKGPFVYIDEHAYNFLSKSSLSGGEIIISNVGANVGTIFKCPNLPYKMSLAPNAITIKLKGDNDFYYYWFKSKIGQANIQALVTGSAQPKFNKTNFRSMYIPVPPLATQRRIASILSSLDRKIELNNKINADLEEMAQAIFKNWFVDFEPFKDGKFVDSELGMIPEGWKVGCLGDMGAVVCGKTPSKSNSNYYGGDIPFIKIPDMHGNVFVENSEDRLTEEGSLSQIKKFIPPYSLMVSCIATVGLVSINTKPSHTNQQINTVIPHNKSALFYLYQYIKNNEELLKNMGRGGTTTLNVNTRSFSNIRLLIPSEIALEQFHRVVEGLFKKIELNLHESRTLSLLRDTLLPRLMSGELEVPE